MASPGVRRVAAVVVLFSAMLTSRALAARDPLPAPIWKNEALRPGQGVMSVEVRGEGFPRATRDPLKIMVRHLPSKLVYVIHQPLLVTKKRQRSLYWKLPAGRFEIVRIERFFEGRTHTSPSDPRFRYFFVDSFSLTDLGVMAPRLVARNKLDVSYHSRMVQSFWFPKGDDSIDAIIDGFSSRRLQAIGGRGHKRRAAMALAAKTPPGRQKAPRDIAILYGMDLHKVYKKYDKGFLPTIKARENNFRQCYLGGLAHPGNHEGSVTFSFALQKGFGTVKTLNYRGGTLANRRTIECLTAQLGQMRFPTRAPLSGQVVLDFKAR